MSIGSGVRAGGGMWWGAMAAVVFLLAASPLRAQKVSVDSLRLNDSTVIHAVQLRDGSRIVGRITARTADSVRVVSSASTTMVARSAIREVRQYAVTAMRNGELWPENPHATRLLFSPTAIPLRKGEAYFSDFWLFLLSAAGGVTDRFTFGGGMTLIPGLALTDNVLYVIPKYTVVDRPGLSVALGGLMALVGGFDDDQDSKSVGVLYGVATAGSRESNVTFGAGWGYIGTDFSSKPILTLGAQHRVARRVALITENWFLPFEGDATGFISYGLRFLGEKLAVDFAFGNALEGDAQFFPGVPLLGFAIKF